MVKIIQGDALTVLKMIVDESVNCCVTSPPYWGIRDYRVEGQLGLEDTPAEYVQNMVEVFREVRRVLRDDGTLWLNMGDSYASGKGTCFNPGGGSSSFHGKQKDAGAYPLARTNVTQLRAGGLKPKDLVGIPWRVALALQADGWYLRCDVVWNKPDAMPESVADRPTRSHEYVFLLAKSQRYHYDGEAIKEPCLSGPSDIRKMQEKLGRIGGKHKELDDTFSKASKETNIGKRRSVGSADGRNKRSVWTIASQNMREEHFAAFPEALAAPCILAGCPEGGVVVDPFAGSGTVGKVAEDLGRNSVLIELKPDYIEIIKRRTMQQNLFLEVSPCD